MKKIIILSIALLAGFLTAGAQDISSLHRKLAQQQDWWEPDTVHVFDKSSVEEYRFTFKYNSQGLLEERIQQQQKDNSWVNFLLSTYTYDSNNNLLTELYQNSLLITYTYDSSNNRLTELYQSWKDNLWINTALYTYTYDSNRNKLTELRQYFENNSWVNSFLSTYTYDSSNNLFTELYQSWSNNSWINSGLNINTYDSDNNMLTQLQHGWSNNAWVNSSLYAYTYDSNNNLLTELYQSWSNNAWVNSSLYTYTYDSNNNMLTNLWQEWNNNSWANTILNTYTYDSDNNMLTELWQFWDINSLDFDHPFQFLRTYDENRNGVSVEFQNWSEEGWQPENELDRGGIKLFYNNMQSNFGFNYFHKMTASYVKVSGNDTGIKDVKQALSIQIYSAGKTIYVSNRTGKVAVVTVYGIDGVKVAEQTMASQTIAMEVPAVGFYLVSVRAGNEKPVTAKVSIR